MRKKIIAGVIILISVLVLVLIYFSTLKDKTNIKVGIFLYTNQQVIDEINTGFKNKLAIYQKEYGKEITIIEKNANGDQMQMDLISNYFINGNFDLIFVVGAPAIKILKDKDCKTPVIFGGPPNPVSMGLVPSLKNHNTNFTGTTYFPPTQKILEIFLNSFPETKTIAVLRNPAEPNSQAVSKSFIENAEKMNIKIVDLPSIDGAQIDASLRSLSIKKVDGLFIPTDNLVYSMLEKVISATNDLKIPVFSCTKLSVQKGALFSVGTDYLTVGELSADVASKIIFQNMKPQNIDVLEITTGEIFLNSKDSLNNKIKEFDNYKIKFIE